MPRLISIADAKKRDAQIELVSPHPIMSVPSLAMAKAEGVREALTGLMVVTSIEVRFNRRNAPEPM